MRHISKMLPGKKPIMILFLNIGIKNMMFLELRLRLGRCKYENCGARGRTLHQHHSGQYIFYLCSSLKKIQNRT